jgi:hypothetical protein
VVYRTEESVEDSPNWLALEIVAPVILLALKLAAMHCLREEKMRTREAKVTNG